MAAEAILAPRPGLERRNDGITARQRHRQGAEIGFRREACVLGPDVSKAVEVVGVQGEAIIGDERANNDERLGASSLRAFFTVTLPNIRAGLIGAGTFAFIISFADVNLSVFLSSIQVQTLPIELMAYVANEADPIGAAVSAWIVLVGVMALFVIDRMVGLRSLSGGGGEAELR